MKNKKWQCTVNTTALLNVLAAVAQHIIKWWMNPLLLPSTAPISFRPRSPEGTTLLPSSARRWARQRTRRGSRADLWTCSTSSCRRTPGAGSAAMTTTSTTCRDPSWSDRWPKSAWWGREARLEGWMEAGRGREGWTQGEYYEWLQSDPVNLVIFHNFFYVKNLV